MIRILRLDIEGFGRFRGRALELAPGLNVLFGRNEAGKSTLHAFLDGMLFGFRQTHTLQGRQRRTRAYTAERERYRPWDGGAYAGSLTYEHAGGRTYLVRRDFARDQLTIRDALTGRDLTAEFDADPATGERDFARRHGGLTPVIFRGTLSVGQGVAGMDAAALGPEIRAILTRAAAPADSPGADASESLRAAAARIGTPRRPATPLGQAQVRLAQLQARRTQALGGLQRTRELEALRDRLTAAQAAAAAAQAGRDRLARARAGARLAQARALRAEIDALPAFAVTRLDELASRERAVREAERSEAMEAHQEALDLRQRAAEATTRRRRLHELAATSEATLAQARGLAAASRPGGARLLAGAGVAALVAGLLLHVPWLVAAGVLAAAAGVWRTLAAARAAAALSHLLAAAGADDVHALAHLEDERRALRAQPDLDPEALLGAAAALEEGATAILAEDGVESARAALRQAPEPSPRALAAAAAVERARADVAAYLAGHGVASAADFRARAAGAEARQRLQARLEGLLAGASLEELAAPFPEGPPPADAGAPTEQEVADAHAAWLGAMEEAGRLAAAEAALRQELGPRPPELGAVESELRAALAERRLLATRRAALDLALDTLEAQRQAVQREFAPVLHRRLGELAPALTAARYAELHVDEELNVTVRVPERSDLVPAGLLSRGAADQIYLAARLALAEVATQGAGAPLLLDESLAHYDDERLLAALDCLSALAASRQILLFTCHGRVPDALRRSGAPHRLVAVERPED